MPGGATNFIGIFKKGKNEEQSRVLVRLKADYRRGEKEGYREGQKGAASSGGGGEKED